MIGTKNFDTVCMHTSMLYETKADKSSGRQDIEFFPQWYPWFEKTQFQPETNIPISTHSFKGNGVRNVLFIHVLQNCLTWFHQKWVPIILIQFDAVCTVCINEVVHK